MYSSEEVVELAVNTEKNGKEFYDNAANKTKSAELKKMFNFLAMQEDRHRMIFESLRGKTERLMEPTDMEEIEGYLNAIVESEFFLGGDKALSNATKSDSPRELLSFALQFEKETLLFFTQISELSEGKTKDVLNEIINEEKKHVKIITELLRQQGIA